MSVFVQGNFGDEITPAREENAEEVNFKCDKLITELLSIQLRIAALKNITAYHGPAIDAERNISRAIKCLQHQKR